MNSSGFNPFPQPVFVQLSQKTAISVHLLNTDSEMLSKELRVVIERDLVSQRGGSSGESYEAHNRKEGFLVQSNHCEVWKRGLEQKVSDSEIILKLMTAAVNQLEEKVCSLQNENRLL